MRRSQSGVCGVSRYLSPPQEDADCVSGARLFGSFDVRLTADPARPAALQRRLIAMPSEAPR